MSLLLDALKKAAEKKAQKNAQNTAVDKTETLALNKVPDETSVTDTVVDKTEAMTEARLEKTEVDATRVDVTQLDTTHLDKTELDATQLDTTHLDKTQLDATQLDTTHLDKTELDATELDSTHFEKSESDPVQKIKEKPAEDSKKPESGESTLEMDIRDLDLSKLSEEQAGHSSEQKEVTETVAGVPVFTDEDKAMLVMDDESAEIEAIVPSQTESVPPVPDDDLSDDETVVLTPDDITEFLGDGIHKKGSRPDPIQAASELLSSDDTTVTNPDSLSLTNIDQGDFELAPQEDQGYPLAQDQTHGDNSEDTSTLSGYDRRNYRQQYDRDAAAVNQEGELSGELKSDSTTSAVDIEKLTNDETVTIKDNTFTRTFAPDNYDRTLVKLTDSDVSRIFPGMKSETDSVMTPDYAKKIFLSKSRGVKNYYYKIYTGIGASILLVMIVFGLFQIQSESESIDNNLISLKRDPMPGVIKPKDHPDTINLFAEPKKVDDKIIDVIANADSIAADVTEPGQSESESQSAADVTQEPSAEAQKSTQNIVASTQTDTQLEISKPTVSTAAKSPQASNRSLQLSSSNRVSTKDELLSQAYAAYEAGNMAEAKSLYQKVIQLDPGNRDAMLGRAAIYVFDNQFENAITLYQKLLVANPKDDLAMTSLISVANVDPQAGESQIKRLLNDIPDSPYLHFALGNMYGNQNRWPEAQTAYFKALQYKPGDPNYAYNMAVSLEHLQKPESAVSFYQRALDNISNGLATFSKDLVAQRIEVLSK